jgi:hypothetical protein
MALLSLYQQGPGTSRFKVMKTCLARPQYYCRQATSIFGPPQPFMLIDDLASSLGAVMRKPRTLANQREEILENPDKSSFLR